MSAVVAMKQAWSIVLTVDGEVIIVDTAKMLRWNVPKQVILVIRISGRVKTLKLSYIFGKN
jgi:hypothetical protein